MKFISIKLSSIISRDLLQKMTKLLKDNEILIPNSSFFQCNLTKEEYEELTKLK